MFKEAEAGWPDEVAHTVIPEHQRPRQEELKFKTSFQSIARPCISRQKRSCEGSDNLRDTIFKLRVSLQEKSPDLSRVNGL